MEWRKLPAIQLSKTTLLVTGQFAANIVLAFWLLMEYLHNPFMQEYVANVWAHIWPVTVVALSGLAGGTASLLFYKSKHPHLFKNKPSHEVSTQETGDRAGLASLDSCPFCNIPLKVLSENRFQCRQCRRYFKSSLPQLAV